jgi:hypothetical protein
MGRGVDRPATATLHETRNPTGERTSHPCGRGSPRSCKKLPSGPERDAGHRGRLCVSVGAIPAARWGESDQAIRQAENPQAGRGNRGVGCDFAVMWCGGVRSTHSIRHSCQWPNGRIVGGGKCIYDAPPDAWPAASERSGCSKCCKRFR